MTKEQYSEQIDTLIKKEKLKSLVLYNDDYHTFEYVIEALIHICKHKETQAVQCTYLVHYTGKSDVKSGTYNDLKPMKDQLILRGLDATIE